ncbi:MAG: AI-2E family transporter [Desulfobacterales bacterium]|nr:MAG: AI-2E family transporter [Desulfobacterales bacterium]
MEFDRTKITFAFQGILVLVAVGMVLKFTQPVVLPLIIAWLLSYLIGPAVNFMTQRKIPTTLAVFVILIILLGIFYLSGTFLYSPFSAFVAAYPKYHSRLTELITTVTSRWNLEFDPLAGINWGQNIGRFLVTFSQSIFGFVSKLVLVIIFLFFILLGKPYFRYKILKSFSAQNADQISQITFSITAQIRRYLSLQFLISFVTGVLVWFVLLLIGVDFAVTWGALAFFLNFIPTVGSILASIPPILLALVQFYPSFWPGVVTLIVLVTIQLGMGNGIAPKVMGDQLNLSPVVVLLSLLFFGWLWGIVGALLSVPIAAAIKIVCENIETLHPISVMMGSGKIYRREFLKSNKSN